MWLFTPDSFISIVQHRDQPDLLLARARFPGDLGRLFPDRAHEVEETPDADYRYRLILDRKAAAQAVATAVCGVDYTNFKDEAGSRPQGTAARMTALHQVWTALFRAQARTHAK